MTQKVKLLAIASLLFTVHSSAEDLNSVIEDTLSQNSEVQSLRTNTKAFRKYVDEEQGKFFPKIDIDTYFEEKETIQDGRADTHQNGTNTQFLLEQTIFDGGLIYNQVEEADHNYIANKYKNVGRIEEIVLESVEAYLGMVRNKEILLLSQNNLKIHEDYLGIAKQSEEVSGDALDRLQVESKLFNARADYVKLKSDIDESRANLIKLYGKGLEGNICRPNIDLKAINPDLIKMTEKAMKTNLTILEELENIKAQRAVLSQEKSRFMPTIKARLLQEIDDGVDVKDVKKTENTARISLSYNIFNGMQDKAIYEREKLFLQEAQENINDVVNGVVEEVKINHSKFFMSQERIKYLKEYLDRNKKILTLYLEQFEGGTRSFLDILNQEAELFSSKQDLIQEEYNYLTSYYTLLNLTGELTDKTLRGEKQVCGEMVVDIEVRNTQSKLDQDIDEELESLFNEDEEETKKQEQEEKVKKLYNQIINEITDPNVKNKNVKIKSLNEANKVEKTKKEPVLNKDESINSIIPESENESKLEEEIKENKEESQKITPEEDEPLLLENKNNEDSSNNVKAQDKEALKRRLEAILKAHEKKKKEKSVNESESLATQ